MSSIHHTGKKSEMKRVAREWQHPPLQLVPLQPRNAVLWSCEQYRQTLKRSLVNNSSRGWHFCAGDDCECWAVQVSRRKNFEDDVEDQVKEEEEKQLLEIEERERKEEEMRAQKGDKRNSIKKDGSKLPGPKKTSSEFSNFHLPS